MALLGGGEDMGVCCLDFPPMRKALPFALAVGGDEMGLSGYDACGVTSLTCSREPWPLRFLFWV